MASSFPTTSSSFWVMSSCHSAKAFCRLSKVFAHSLSVSCFSPHSELSPSAILTPSLAERISSQSARISHRNSIVFSHSLSIFSFRSSSWLFFLSGSSLAREFQVQLTPISWVTSTVYSDVTHLYLYDSKDTASSLQPLRDQSRRREIKLALHHL